MTTTCIYHWESTNGKTESEGNENQAIKWTKKGRRRRRSKRATGQGRQDQEEVQVDSARAASVDATVSDRLPEWIQPGFGKLLMMYASKQSYTHLVIKDYAKLLLGISEKRTSEHQCELAKVAKESSGWHADAGLCLWDDSEAVQDKALEIRMCKLG